MGNNTYYVKSTEEKRADPQLLVQGEQVTGLNKIRNLKSFLCTAGMVNLKELCCFLMQ